MTTEKRPAPRSKSPFQRSSEDDKPQFVSAEFQERVMNQLTKITQQNIGSADLSQFKQSLVDGGFKQEHVEQAIQIVTEKTKNIQNGVKPKMILSGIATTMMLICSFGAATYFTIDEHKAYLVPISRTRTFTSKEAKENTLHQFTNLQEIIEKSVDLGKLSYPNKNPVVSFEFVDKKPLNKVSKLDEINMQINNLFKLTELTTSIGYSFSTCPTIKDDWRLHKQYNCFENYPNDLELMEEVAKLMLNPTIPQLE